MIFSGRICTSQQCSPPRTGVCMSKYSCKLLFFVMEATDMVKASQGVDDHLQEWVRRERKHVYDVLRGKRKGQSECFARDVPEIQALGVVVSSC